MEFSTRQPYPDARRLLDAGVTVALASDCNPGSCYTGSMPLCIALAVREMGMTPAEAVHAATYGGAGALGRDDVGAAHRRGARRPRAAGRADARAPGLPPRRALVAGTWIGGDRRLRPALAWGREAISGNFGVVSIKAPVVAQEPEIRQLPDPGPTADGELL